MDNMTSTQNEDLTGGQTSLQRNLFGLCFALSSSLFVGSGYIINKISTERIVQRSPTENVVTSPLRHTSGSSETKYTLRDRGASSTENNEKLGFKFLLSPLWWLYILCTILGEGSNFMAYQKAPATLVTPLGALSMVVTCILSSYFLNERMDIVSRLGVTLAILGAIFVILNAPANPEIASLDVLVNDYICQTPFLVYSCLNVAAIFACFTQRKKHFFYRVLLASLASAFVVISSKSVGIAVAGVVEKPANVSLSGNTSSTASVPVESPFTNPIFYCLVATLVLCTILNIIQVTMALNMGEASTVIPVHYVCFTTSVIIGMNILFKEYASMNEIQLISVLAGFGVLVIAVFLIQMFKNDANADTAMSEMPSSHNKRIACTVET